MYAHKHARAHTDALARTHTSNKTLLWRLWPAQRKRARQQRCFFSFCLFSVESLQNKILNLRDLFRLRPATDYGFGLPGKRFTPVFAALICSVDIYTELCTLTKPKCKLKNRSTKQTKLCVSLQLRVSETTLSSETATYITIMILAFAKNISAVFMQVNSKRSDFCRQKVNHLPVILVIEQIHNIQNQVPIAHWNNVK